MPNRPQPRLLQALFIAGAALRLAAGPRRPKRSLLWSAVLFAADLVAIPAILRAKPAISKAELKALDPGILPPLDRLALRLPVKDREAIRKSSDNLLRALVAAPALLLSDGKLRQRAAAWLQDYVWGHALTYTVYTFSPPGPAFSDKYRPVVYRSEVPAAERRRGNNRNSQYSGHTGNAAFACFFTARLLLRSRQIGTGSKLGLLGIATVPALILGSLRVRAQKHFPSDVLLASGIGALIALSLGLDPE